MMNEPSTSGPCAGNPPDLEDRLKRSIEQDWRDEVVRRLAAEHPGYTEQSAEQQFARFLDYVLHTDMRHYWVATQDVSPRPWFVQVEHVEDVSQPAKRRYVAQPSRNGAAGGSCCARMLKMTVFDGKSHHVAIEHAQLSFSSGWPKLGSKLVIDPGAVVRDGVFLLTPGTCGVLGGAVNEFEARQRVVDEVLQEPVYGRRGPPLRLEEYMKEVQDKVRERVGADHHTAASGAPPALEVRTGQPAVHIADAEDTFNRNKRHMIQEDSSDDEFGDVSKRLREVVPAPQSLPVPTNTNANRSINEQHIVIDLLSSDDD